MTVTFQTQRFIRRPPAPALCLVIPCFNEEDVLPLLIERLRAFGAAQTHLVRVLFVDDGSKDRTFEILDQACSSDERLAAIRLSRNFGHQTAVSAGLRYAQGDLVAVLDADLQDPPEVIPAMIAKWREGYDVVYGVRQNRKEGHLLRACYALYYRLLKSVANIDLPLDAGDFSLMDRVVVDHVNAMPEHNRYVRGLRGWVGFRQCGLAYDRDARAGGAPKYNLRRLLRLAFDGLVSFSSAPLKLAMWVGSLTALFAFVLALWAMASALFLARLPPGWASLAIIVLFFSGVQLLVLGILGEYIGRVFDEVKGRPIFIEARRTGWITERIP